MLVMLVIVLHPYTKIEVHRPSRSEDMADFRSVLSSLVTLTFEVTVHVGDVGHCTLSVYQV